jgi:hypothetical protein
MKTDVGAFDTGSATLLDCDMPDRMRVIREAELGSSPTCSFEAGQVRVFEPLERAWRLGPSSHVFARKSSELSEAIDRVFGSLAEVELERRARRILSLDTRPVGGGTIRLYANGLPIVRVRADDELPPMLEATIVGFAVRTRDDAAPLHAASVALGGKGVLLPGGKGSGKSTLALRLAQEGGTYYGDEVAFIRFSDRKLEAFPKAVTLKEGSFSLFPETATFQDAIRGRIRYHMPASAARAKDAAAIGLIVFPHYVAGGPAAQLEALDPAQAAFDLVRQCFGGLERDPRTMSVLAALSSVPVCALAYSDAGAAAKAIARLATTGRMR